METSQKFPIEMFYALSGFFVDRKIPTIDYFGMKLGDINAK